MTSRVIVALLPFPGNVAVIALVLRWIRSLDEFVYGYLEKAHAAGPLNAVVIWVFILVSCAIGYVLAASHYQ